MINKSKLKSYLLMDGYEEASFNIAITRVIGVYIRQGPDGPHQYIFHSKF